MDGGYLQLWSGSRNPEEVRGPDIPPSVDFEVVGPDADAAARAFDRQSGRTLYDIPRDRADAFAATFEAARHGLDASLRAFPTQVPHRERVRRAIAGGEPDFLISGVPVVAIGGVPADRALPVLATEGEDEWSWAHFRIVCRDGSAVASRRLGPIGIDWARFVFADADALDAWEHERPIDGLADVVFWGRDAERIAAELGVGPTGTAGEQDTFGWLNLPVEQARGRALALDGSLDRESRWVKVDFRPHSHHWQVMADVRGSEYDVATIEVGGARMMYAMTSVGDGFFPVTLELDADGVPVAVQITVTDDESSEEP